MYSQIITAAAVLLPVLISAGPVPRSNPPCSSNPVSCVCPSGTTFGNATTYAIFGARATDVFSIMGDFYETDWFGLPTVAKNGPDNTVGSKRTLNVTSGTSTYQLIETLLSASQKPDGSFRQQFEQSNVPVVVPQAQGGGGYSGYWVTYEVDQTILEYESLIAWNVYWCVTGNPFPFASFHENVIRNVTSILQGQNKVHGINVGPYSIQTN